MVESSFVPSCLPEILAPAGELISLQAALDAGCDAVYLGIDCFSMRQMAAKGFSIENLPEAGARCHEAGRKLYLTLNTIVFEDETAHLRDVVERVKPHIDAAIVSDWAAIAICRAAGVPFHCSTQMSCANSLSARFLKSMGAERVVLARECTLGEIRRIAAEARIETEIFVHGATCVAESGRCFLSHEAYGRSCNRGTCLQPCRREYHISEVRKGRDAEAEFVVGMGYVLSARDLCSLPFLDQVWQAGAASWKIEGRARNADYVHTVVSAYRRGRDALAKGIWTAHLGLELQGLCERVYHRPFGQSLFNGRPGVDQFTEDDRNMAKSLKLNLGVVRNYYAKPSIAEILVQDHLLRPGARLSIQGPTTGLVEFDAEELRQDERSLEEVPPGQWCTLRVPRKVRLNDRVFLVVRNPNTFEGNSLQPPPDLPA